MSTPDEIKDEFGRLRREGMPSGNEMAELARTAYRDRHGESSLDADQLRASFDGAILELLETEYRLYLDKEREVNVAILQSHLLNDIPPNAFVGEQLLEATLSDKFDDLTYFFLGLMQSRKSRAGKSFELHTRNLFKRLSYPFEENIIINGKPDFVLPSAAHFKHLPTDCIIFTLKRTLRERWRQIITEGAKGAGFFLGTIDERLTSQQLEEMKGHRVNLVVPKRILEEQATYQQAGNVISFVDFFEDQIDPAVKRWKKSGVVSS